MAGVHKASNGRFNIGYQNVIYYIYNKCIDVVICISYLAIKNLNLHPIPFGLMVMILSRVNIVRGSSPTPTYFLYFSYQIMHY